MLFRPVLIGELQEAEAALKLERSQNWGLHDDDWHDHPSLSEIHTKALEMRESVKPASPPLLPIAPALEEAWHRKREAVAAEYARTHFAPDATEQTKVVLPWGMTIWPRVPVSN